jgi:hypothetical protein
LSFQFGIKQDGCSKRVPGFFDHQFVGGVL